jgi:hypothetical protein
MRMLVRHTASEVEPRANSSPQFYFEVLVERAP